MALKEWARKKNRELHRQALEDRDSRLWHSGSYHRYFDGYTEYRELDQNGKERLRRVYTAPWRIQDLPPRRRALQRCLYLVLFLLMAGAVVWAGILQAEGGTAFFTVIPELAVLCLLAWLGYVLLVQYLFQPEKMTLYDYRASSVSLRRVSLFLGWAFLCAAAAALLEGILKGAFGGALIPFGAFAAGAACAFGMNRAEELVPYREEENSRKPVPGEVPVEGED